VASGSRSRWRITTTAPRVWRIISADSQTSLFRRRNRRLLLRARIPDRSERQNTNVRGTPAPRRDVAQEDLVVRRVAWVEDNLPSYCERTGENRTRGIEVLVLRFFNDRHFKDDVRERARAPVRHLELQDRRILLLPRWRRGEPNHRNPEGQRCRFIDVRSDGRGRNRRGAPF
jgi:hypothetical protein